MSLPQLLFCTLLRFSLPPLEHPSIPKLPWQDSSGDADKLSGRGGSFLSRRLSWTYWNFCDAASLSLSKFEQILPVDHEWLVSDRLIMTNLTDVWNTEKLDDLINKFLNELNAILGLPQKLAEAWGHGGAAANSWESLEFIGQQIPNISCQQIIRGD